MWNPTKNKKLGVCIYNYNGNTKYGLSLEIGETVQILEECGGWYRGISTRNKCLKGIFPSSYIHLKPFHIDNEGLYETVTPVEDSTVREIACVLREWLCIWKKLYIKREGILFQRLQTVMRDLIEKRRQLITGTLTQDQIRELKEKITGKIDWGNRQLGLDLVPRLNSDVVDSDTLSPVELHQVHVRSSESVSGSKSHGTIKKKELRKVYNHHLYLCVRDFSYNLGEDTEIFFSLYDALSTEFISERFLVRFTKFGMSHFIEKLHNNCTVFTDLSSTDLQKELYLVAHIIRSGRMLNDSKKTVIHTYRRPYGCSVISLTDVMVEKSESMLEDEREFTAKVYTSSSESDFNQLHDFIIKKLSNKFNVLSGQQNYGLILSLRMLHGELSQLQQETPMLFKNLPITHKQGFSDVIMPGDVRNDLYLTLEKGDFEKGGKSTGKNIEATVLLVSPEGFVLEKCINPGSGHENVTEYHSIVLYHNNMPRWAETVKLAIPIEKFDGAHVRIEYRHCSTRDKDKKLLGFSFIQLMDDKGTILRNGHHELYVYKCEERPKLQDPKSYLSLPSGPKEGTLTPGCSSGMNMPIPPSPPPFPNSIAGQFFQRSSRETVGIRTLLCSTKLTQNGDLLSLLKWKAHPDRIHDTLHKVMKLDGEETVKFLQDILDALFSMFSTGDGNSTSHSGLVFKVLVHILNLLEDSKFEHFKPVMDAYITGHFAAALVYKGLISCVKHCADLVRDADKQDAIQKCFRSLEYIFKFIIQSRILFARATGDQSEEAFKADLYSLFSSFNRMLSINHDIIILPTQIALVSSFGQIYEQLQKVLPVQEVAKIVKLTIDCLPTDPPSALIQAKLQCIHDTVKSIIFQNTDSRVELLDVFARHLKNHLYQLQELSTCANILGDILTYLHHVGEKHRPKHFPGGYSYISREVEIFVLVLLETLICCVRDIERNNPNAGPLVACLVALLRLMEDQHYTRLWENFGDIRQKRDKRQLKDFLLNLFTVFLDLVKQNIFPSDWVMMKMLTNHVILCALQEFAQPLILDFLDGITFDEQLWSNYFSLAISFLTQPSLQLETFSNVKKEKIVEKYGDMRVLMGFQILSMWDKLGDHKIFFIPAMVGPFLEVTLVPEIELRKATLPIFFDMMDCEQKVKGNFKQVESELIDKLDILVSDNKGDDEYRQLFNTMLRDRVRTNDPMWKENGIAFINSITRLLERLLDYRNVMDGDENRDKRMSCTVNLLNFYKNEINRKEMYIRYIYKLCELHLPAENYSEAAFTLKLHADLLSWSNCLLPADQRYNQQPEWQRREMLYLRIIDYFDKGKCWEEGIPLCKEIAELYEKKLLDYAKLSTVLKTQAKFFDNILNQIRPEPEYFRVGFYGLGFPLFLRNKVFVYRGLEYERIGAFTQRLQTEFPQAQILMKSTPPDDNILYSEGQYIQICNVKPIPKVRAEFEGRDIPEKIINYYLVNDVCAFQFDRPIQKGPIDKENEFKSLWIERTTLRTASHLPGILRWFEVIESQVIELSPISHACESVEHMNKELRKLIAQYTAEPRRSISPLSMRLQGVIEAAVNGGIAKYQEAFFTPEFSAQNPEQINKIMKLKCLILEKVQILEGGLSLHGRLAPSEVIPLHRRLVDRFSVMKQSIREVESPNLTSRLSIGRQGSLPLHHNTDSVEYRKASIVNTPLPPLPCDTIKKIEPCNSNRSSSSGSGSIYGHFLPEGSDDEDIYTHPQDQNMLSKVPISHDSPSPSCPPPLPNRPRSVALGLVTDNQGSMDRNRLHSSPSQDNGEDYSHPRGHPCSRLFSPNIPVRWPQTPDGTLETTAMANSPTSDGHSRGSARNSWSEQSLLLEDEAPPLPPRGGDRRMASSWTGVSVAEDPKPALPRRLVRKGASPSMMGQSKELQPVSVIMDNLDSPSPIGTPITPTPSPFSDRSLETSPSREPPPPLPGKKSGGSSSSGLVKSNPETPIGTPIYSSPMHSPENRQSAPAAIEITDRDCETLLDGDDSTSI